MTATVTIPEAPTDPVGLAQNAESLRSSQSLSGLGDRYVGEPKLDGWRLLLHVADDGVHIYTRTGKSHDGSLPAIEQEAAEHLPPGTWLDGEAVALSVTDGKITHDWATVQSVLGSSTSRAAALSDKITFMAFDLLAHGGIDARRLPYAKRRSLLERAVGSGLSRIQIVPQVTVSDESLAALLSQGFEGLMAKDVTAPYSSGKRGHGWIKVKPQDNLDAVVMDFTPGANGFTGLIGAVVFGQHDESGRLVEVGRCSGMDMKTRQHMSNHPEQWVGQVIEVKHMGKMKTGLRHPQFARRREDKAPRECLLD